MKNQTKPSTLKTIYIKAKLVFKNSKLYFAGFIFIISNKHIFISFSYSSQSLLVFSFSDRRPTI